MTNISTQENLNWLKQWFSQAEGNSNKGEIKGDTNYFEQGLIDSFGLIELIVAIEKEFGVKLLEQHFQDKRFSTLNGLVQIIQELKTAKECA